MSFIRDGVLRDPILVVSPWFEARRGAYQDGLLRLSLTGQWDDWVLFFATGVAEAADTTRLRVEQPPDRSRSVYCKTAPHHATRRDARARLAELDVVDEERVGGRVSFVANQALALLRM
jgi:hypothetical protein